jgi:hypothetical protein
MRYVAVLFTAMFLFVLIPSTSTQAQNKVKSSSLLKASDSTTTTSTSASTARAKKYLRGLIAFVNTDEFKELSKQKNRDAIKARVRQIGLTSGYSAEGKSITKQFNDDLKAADHNDKELKELIDQSPTLFKSY